MHTACIYPAYIHPTLPTYLPPASCHAMLGLREQHPQRHGSAYVELGSGGRRVTVG